MSTYEVVHIFMSACANVRFSVGGVVHTHQRWGAVYA